jgi:hypothetical protein
LFARLLSPTGSRLAGAVREPERHRSTPETTVTDRSDGTLILLASLDRCGRQDADRGIIRR